MVRALNGTLLFILLFSACQKQAKVDNQTAPSSAGLEVKDRLGEGMAFPKATVADQLGNRCELYNLLNKPANIVLLVDASCPACAEEGEKIQSFVWGNPRIGLVGVSKDSLAAILEFKKRHGLLFPVLQDLEEKLVPDYRRVTYPNLLLVGPDRKIIKLYEGKIPAAESEPLLQLAARGLVNSGFFSCF